jgi:hypothetical protein
MTDLKNQPWFANMQKQVQKYYVQPTNHVRWPHGTEVVFDGNKIAQRLKLPSYLDPRATKLSADDRLLRNAVIILIVILAIAAINKFA